MDKKVSYVAGLMFNENRTRIALVRKNRPEWQAGKLNGIGGKMNPGEIPLTAMIREFEEEAGLRYEGWKKFCELVDHDYVVHFYKAFTDDIDNIVTNTDEQIITLDLKELEMDTPLFNIPWLVKLALDDEMHSAVVYYDKLRGEG